MDAIVDSRSGVLDEALLHAPHVARLAAAETPEKKAGCSSYIPSLFADSRGYGLTICSDHEMTEE